MYVYISMHVLPDFIGRCTVTWEAQTLVLGSSEGEAFPQINNWANCLCDWICLGVTPEKKKDSMPWARGIHDWAFKKCYWHHTNVKVAGIPAARMQSEECQAHSQLLTVPSSRSLSLNWGEHGILYPDGRRSQNGSRFFLVVELPCENKVTDSSLVMGVWTQHWGKYLTKAHTVKSSQYGKI